MLLPAAAVVVLGSFSLGLREGLGGSSLMRTTGLLLSSRLPLGDAEGLDWASSVTSEMMGPELVDESGE